MSLPAVDRARILESLARFDREERDSPKWRDWEGKGNFKYAIVHDGQLYPVKEIVSLATGTPTSGFSGGTQANGLVQKTGFSVEALHLPTESEVQIALHELLLSKASTSIEPAEAYEGIADKFALPARLRSKRMENSDEVHWQNRVRFAHRKLVDAGVVDPSEHGRWKLVVRTQPKVWVEKCLLKGRPDRATGPNALGKALWSPTSAQNGADIYRNMRLVQPNDIVLHMTDNVAFTGASIADSYVDTSFIGVEGTTWAGLPCYRIVLRGFSELRPPLTREELVSSNERRDRLVSIHQKYSNLFYDPDLDLHQGGYLTEAPSELVGLLDQAYRDIANRPLPLVANAPTTINVIPKSAPVANDERIWLYAPGRNAMYWNEFRQAGIAAIGWDDIGDLTVLNNQDAIKARGDEIYADGMSKVDALQCFDFAYRMQPGDWIFVKRGRREIIGFGVIKSDYRFEANRPHYPHVRDVEWRNAGSWSTATDRLLAMKTLTQITDDTELVEELEGLIEDVEPPPSLETGFRAPEYSAEDFSTETAIPVETIRQWENRLKRKQHVIFQGPPGTGKTFIAERLARLSISGRLGFSETLQFHPSYSYEDFMHGLRPTTLDGQLVFERVHGRFMQFCDRAARVTDGSPCVLIIDEINRGNLSRIFGELMYLLEYRDKAIPLAGESRPFRIPQNVFLVGTMNTADRSIALVDHALRRRFSFIHLGPDYEVLRSQLERSDLPSDQLVETLRAINASIDDRNYEVGISFFLKDGEKLRNTLQDVWEGEIEPYLEEFFYDQPGKVEPFRWKALATGKLAEWVTES
jgi:MoxR-like ATPase